MNIFKEIYKALTIDTSKPENWIFRIEINREKSDKIWYTPQTRVNAWGYRWLNIINAVDNGLISIEGSKPPIKPEASSMMTESYIERDKALTAIENFKKAQLEKYNKDIIETKHERV